MLRRFAVSLALVAATLPVCLSTQQNPQAPAPDATCLIAGRITSAQDGRPLTGAVVRLIRWEGGRGTPSTAQSDREGKFEFKTLRPGEYELTVTADRHISLGFGQRVPSDPTGRINLSPGMTFTKADIALPRTSAIEGRLIDEFGDPVPGVTVQASRVMFAAGKRRFIAAGGPSATRPTDDLGRFRVTGLPPGDYYLLALAGPFAGPGADEASGFAPTFYPGTRVPIDAQAVNVGIGQEVRDVSFQLSAAPMLTLSGRAVDPSGQPVRGADVTLWQTHGGDVRAMVSARMPADQDGSFSFRNVAPGTYVIQAYGRPVGSGSLAASPFGALPVTMGTDNLGDLIVTVSGVTVRGRFTFEGSAPTPAVGRVSLMFTPVEFVFSPVVGGPPAITVHDDWTFDVSNMSGRRVIRAITGSADWQLKRVMLDGRDVTDEPIDFTKGPVGGLEVIFTSSSTAITGTVTDRNQPATSYLVVAFAADPAKWTFPSRFLGAGGPNQQGSFKISGLPAGDYLVIAVDSSQTPSMQDPEFLEKLRPLATHVTLTEGGSATVALIKR